MENQHRKITGYRELNAEEIALMNDIKALGPVVEALIIKVQAHVALQREAVWEGVERSNGLIARHRPSNPELEQRLNDATPERFAAMAKTEFQTGLMYLTRAVAQPTTY